MGSTSRECINVVNGCGFALKKKNIKEKFLTFSICYIGKRKIKSAGNPNMIIGLQYL